MCGVWPLSDAHRSINAERAHLSERTRTVLIGAVLMGAHFPHPLSLALSVSLTHSLSRARSLSLSLSLFLLRFLSRSLSRSLALALEALEIDLTHIRSGSGCRAGLQGGGQRCHWLM